MKKIMIIVCIALLVFSAITPQPHFIQAFMEALKHLEPVKRYGPSVAATLLWLFPRLGNFPLL